MSKNDDLKDSTRVSAKSRFTDADLEGVVGGLPGGRRAQSQIETAWFNWPLKKKSKTSPAPRFG